MEADLIREEVEAICRAPALRRSPTLKALARHLCEASLHSGDRPLGQYALAIDALECGEDFDPSTQSNVRVNIGRLRAKLSLHYRYYSSVNGCRIEIPKGSYRLSARREVRRADVDARRYQATTSVGDDSQTAQMPTEEQLIHFFQAIISASVSRCMLGAAPAN